MSHHPPPAPPATDERRPSASSGPCWRSIEELAETGEFLEYLHREFPQQASQWSDQSSRRDFLKLMGASLALAGLSGCAEKPPERIVPYVQAPEEIVPGQPLYYATAAALPRSPLGLLVESHMGRPTKIEGNPDHPASLGAADLFAQASLLTLYDPDRSQAASRRGQLASTRDLARNLQAEVALLRASGGRGMCILTEPVVSPTLGAQLAQIVEAFPQARVYQWTPIFDDAEEQGLELAFGDDAAGLQTRRHLDRAAVVLSLDADFLACGHAPPRDTRDFMKRRRAAGAGSPGPSMSRLYAVESTPTLTGSKADHRLARKTREIISLAFDLARRLGVPVETPAHLPEHRVPEYWLEALIQDLREYRIQPPASQNQQNQPTGALVLAGAHLPPVVHALTHAINARLQSVGITVTYTERTELLPANQQQPRGLLPALAALVDEMQRGDVSHLFILGGNPVYDAPADLNFAEALQQVAFSLHLSQYPDETSQRCTWHVPLHHFLESWSDLRGDDGTSAIVQPLIAPLHPSWSPHVLLARLLGDETSTDYDIVQNYWRDHAGADDFDAWWHEALFRGVIENGQLASRTPRLRADFAEALQSADADAAANAPTNAAGDAAADSGDFEVLLRPDPTIWDGRFANNAWLQELPKPLTKLTWDNAALVSLADAQELGVTNGDFITIAAGETALRMPVWILPGQLPRTITLHLGYGRTAAGSVGNGAGFNVYPLRTSRAPWFREGVRVTKAGGRYPLATTVHHHLIDPQIVEDRHLVRSGTVQQLKQNPEHPEFVHSGDHAHDGQPPSFYPRWDLSAEKPQHVFQWGMVIDQTACTGCSACVVACQSENNIPVVGKQEVARGREMHWLRIDTYYKGDLHNPEGPYHQPLLCMHCENAPCEVVCPVAATTHSEEGLNEMTYNRCVGTRYCSNNCPYKVRRFNFLSYDAAVRESPLLQLMQNPDVTVRSNGVMEKCTFCVQRLNAARIDAKKSGAPVNDVQVQTACQQVCPAEAIIFGDLANPDSRVRALRDDPLNYELLGELNTRPRTTYLAAVRNPNEDIQRQEFPPQQ